METHPDQVLVERIPREIWVLIASAFVIAIGFGFITPVLPVFAKSFNVSATLVSVVVSAFAFFRLVFAPTSGKLVTMLSERVVYLTGVLLVAASSAATAFATSYGQLLFFRSIGGIGSTMFTVSAAALVVRLSPATIRGRVSSAFASSFLVGGIVGPLLGGVLSQAFGLRVPFLAYAALLVVAAAMVGWFIPKTTAAQRHENNGVETLTFVQARGVLAYQASLVAGFAFGWANFGFRIAITPLFIFHVITQAESAPGIALSVLAVGNVIGIVGTGRLLDRWGRKPFIVGGMLVSGIATGLTGFVTTMTGLIVLSILAGIGAGAVNPAQQAALADLIGKGRNGAPALAAYQMAQDSGTILGPILAGVIVDLLGFTWAFVVTGLVGSLAVLPWLAARETLHSPPITAAAASAHPTEPD